MGLSSVALRIFRRDLLSGNLNMLLGALILAVTAAILAVVGRKQLKEVKGLEKSNQSITKTRELLSRATGA